MTLSDRPSPLWRRPSVVVLPHKAVRCRETNRQEAPKYGPWTGPRAATRRRPLGNDPANVYAFRWSGNPPPAPQSGPEIRRSVRSTDGALRGAISVFLRAWASAPTPSRATQAALADPCVPPESAWQSQVRPRRVVFTIHDVLVRQKDDFELVPAPLRADDLPWDRHRPGPPRSSSMLSLWRTRASRCMVGRTDGELGRSRTYGRRSL